MTVTKQQQLEWLAKNLEKWNSGYDFAVVDKCSDGGFYVRWPSVCSSGITKKEWQQERDKTQKQPAQSKPDNSWQAYGELPPVGCECEAMINGEWIAAEVLRHRINSAGMNVAAVMSCASFGVYWAADFRPLRTEREKAIDAACKAIGVAGEDGLLMIERLYDAGLLK